MPVPAIFGIENDGINLAINLLILFLVVVYLALIAYTYLDAKRRLEDSVLIGCATVTAMIFPFVGTIVYTILRPPEFLEDARERKLEIRASELRVRQLEDASCPNCEHPVERTYLRCPNCRARIKDPCESCGKPVDPRWSICPYCETPMRAAAASPQRLSQPPEGRGGGTKTTRTKTTRPTRAKRPVTRETPSRPAKSKAKAPVRRSTSSKKPTRRRSEPGDGTAPAS